MCVRLVLPSRFKGECFATAPDTHCHCHQPSGNDALTRPHFVLATNIAEYEVAIPSSSSSHTETCQSTAAASSTMALHHHESLHLPFPKQIFYVAFQKCSPMQLNAEACSYGERLLKDGYQYLASEATMCLP